MTHPKDLRIEDYTYALPESRIAKYPLEQRDASKLLIYEQARISQDRYQNLAAHIPERTLMVFNQTKVVNARLLFHKTTGGVIEVFCLEPHEQYGDVQTAMLQKKCVLWKCLIGGASKWKHGLVLSQSFPESSFTLRAAIVERETGFFILELSWDNDSLSFAEVLQVAGKVPLPPYLHREADNDDKDRYQTVYAKDDGSVAAPTAGLHFTEEIMQSLDRQSIHTAFVSLHVGAGTFKPVKSVTMAGHDMHAEWIDVSIELIQSLTDHLSTGIVAVGTTSLRTIESLYWIGAKILMHQLPEFGGIAVNQWEPYEMEAKGIEPSPALQALVDWMLHNHQIRLVTRTQILIAPGYQFRIIRGLVTNFHQPQSTLLLLVAALVGEDWRKIYEYALNNEFRFLSYGDGSLLWSNQSLNSVVQPFGGKVICSFTPSMNTRDFIAASLKEDIGSGDYSTMASISADAKGRAILKVKEDGILAGVELAQEIFHYLEPEAVFNVMKKDGDVVKYGEIAFEVSARVHTILQAERLALNCMQRMSGIATLTNQYVQEIKEYRSKVLDTRKTTPLFRTYEKEAVRIGGGHNHRMGLYDMVMLKDNHIDFCGGIRQAIEKTSNYLKANNLDLKIEVETRSLDDVRQVLEVGGVHRIMLDNYNPDQLAEAIQMIGGKYETEASGGIQLENVEEYAKTGVDFISVGAIIHHAVSMDLSLKAQLA